MDWDWTDLVSIAFIIMGVASAGLIILKILNNIIVGFIAVWILFAMGAAFWDLMNKRINIKIIDTCQDKTSSRKNET